jgi:hypothetical protein
MRQSAFTILAPVTAGAVEDLESLLDEIGNDIRGNPHLRFGALEGLHYASLFVFVDGARDACLVFEGNVDGRTDKAYARFSMVPTNVWYSAYPDISVANIDNNMRIRADLVAPLDRSATEAWLRRL